MKWHEHDSNQVQNIYIRIFYIIPKLGTSSSSLCVHLQALCVPQFINSKVIFMPQFAPTRLQPTWPERLESYNAIKSGYTPNLIFSASEIAQNPFICFLIKLTKLAHVCSYKIDNLCNVQTCEAHTIAYIILSTVLELDSLFIYFSSSSD